MAMDKRDLVAVGIGGMQDLHTLLARRVGRDELELTVDGVASISTTVSALRSASEPRRIPGFFGSRRVTPTSTLLELLPS